MRFLWMLHSLEDDALNMLIGMEEVEFWVDNQEGIINYNVINVREKSIRYSKRL